MTRVHISEVLPIVVDPKHERFGQIGELVAGDPEFGDCLIRFADDEPVLLNDGYTTGIPQFVAPLKVHEAGVRALQAALPDMKSSLLNFSEQIAKPLVAPANKVRNNAARAGFVALINDVIFDSQEQS